MDDELKAAIEELQNAIARSEADGVIDDGERTELRELVSRLGAALDAAGDEDRDGLSEQFEAAAARFDTNHPTLSAVIRSVVDTLAGYGI